MEPLDPRLRELVDAGMRAAVPDDATQARSLARFLAALPTVPGPGVADATPAVSATTTAAATTTGGKLGLKLVVVALVVAGGGTLGVAMGTRGGEDAIEQRVEKPPPSPTSRGVASPSQRAPATPQPASSIVDAPPPLAASPHDVKVEPVPSPRRAPKAVARERSTVEPAETVPTTRDENALLAETQLVAAAHAALERSDARAALAVLRDHAKRFPNGQLALERRGLELAAGCILDPEGTRDTASAFLQRHGRTSAAARVRAGCKATDR